MADAPTPTQIAAHLAAGGHIERRSTPTGPWLSSADHPQIADRDWHSFPDEPWPTYRLVGGER